MTEIQKRDERMNKPEKHICLKHKCEKYIGRVSYSYAINDYQEYAWICHQCPDTAIHWFPVTKEEFEYFKIGMNEIKGEILKEIKE